MSKGTIADPRPCAAIASPPSKRLAKKGITDQSEASAQHRAGGGHGNRRRPARPGWERERHNRQATPISPSSPSVTPARNRGRIWSRSRHRDRDRQRRLRRSCSATSNATLQFPQGALTERVADTAPPKAQFDPITCVLKTLEQQHFTAVGATGTLAGTTGSGTATVSTTIIEARGSDGACAQHAPPLLVLVIVHETGALAVSEPSPTN